MNFSTVSRVQQTIRAGDEVEFRRGSNRVKVNNAANCAPPLDPAEAKKLGIKINVNWGELMILLAHARRQYMTAFWGQQYFFKVSLPYAPKEHQSEWGACITEEINRVMKKSIDYFELHRNKWAAVVCHGVGPMMWYRNDGWLPDFVAIEDLRIPTDTTLNFRNLGWYGTRHIYTPGELITAAFDEGKNNRWNKKRVANILKNYKEINFDYAPNHYDWETTPEKLAELVKQDGGYYASDAMPGIPLWHFMYDDPTPVDPDKRGWYMKIVPEQSTVRGAPEEFLWEDNDRPVAPTWRQRLHCQYGDLSNKTPFVYHSVRSLGYALLEPTFYDNLTKCRLMQHIHDNFNVWLRITDPAEKARAALQEFGNYGVIKSGVSVVPSAERHQIDPNLVEMGLAQMAELKSQASASYTQQPDTGTKKEQTAFETSVKMQQVNAMMGGLLMTAFIYETPAYTEICRRFCLQHSEDEDILHVQKVFQKVGIPRQHLDVKLWDIQPVTPLGMGNPAIAQAEAQQLMQQRGAYDPEAQQEILHEFTLVTTGDARKAARWAPIGKDKPMNDGMIWAVAVFGTLMQGIPVPPREGISPLEQLDALLPMLAGVITRIEQRAGGGGPQSVITPDELAGVSAVGQYLGGLIQMIAQDPAQKARVKQYGDVIGKLMNQVKAMAQRAQQQAQQQARQQQNGNGGDPSARAKIQATLLQASVKAKAVDAKNKQAMAHKQKEFIASQRRQDAETFAQIQREGLKTKAKLKSTRE